MDARRLSPPLAETLAVATRLAARSPLRWRPFVIGFGLAVVLQACAAVSVVSTAASVATTAATTAVSAGVTVAEVGVSTAGGAVKAITP